MTRRTFHGDAAAKDRYVERLRGHIAAGHFQFAPRWQDGRGSALGCTIEADDPGLYAEQLGYPDALALVLDDLVNFRRADPDGQHAKSFAIRWLVDTPVGVDLSPVTGQALCEMLDVPQLRDIAAGHPDIDAARRAVIDLHRLALRGEVVSRDRWRDARREAVRITDGTADEVARLAAQAIEAAAWPHTARTVLSDMLAALSRMESAWGMRNIGWTAEQEDAIFTLFGTISRGAVGEPPVGEALLAEVARRDPDLAVRFEARCEAMSVAQMIYTVTGDIVLRHIAGTDR